MTNGVLPNPSNNLQVQTGTGMNVIINPGFAICNGCLKLEETQRTMSVQASNDTYDRIDTVVLRLNDNDSVRECDFYVLQGVPATSPVRPELTQTDSIWEIGLADLFISKNSTVISADKITDTRYETARCGIISAIAEFDTTTIYNQIQADLAEFKNEEQADILAWFEDIKGQLSGDVAVNLQNQIGALSLLDTNAKSDLVSAINEVNSKEVTVLDSLEEIEANTDGGKVAGALGVKEMFAEVSESLGNLYSKTLLASITVSGETIPLNTPITNFKKVRVYLTAKDRHTTTMDFDVEDIVYASDGYQWQLALTESTEHRVNVRFSFIDTNTIYVQNLHATGWEYASAKIYGIK